MKQIVLIFCTFFCLSVYGQSGYLDSMQSFRDHYVQEHEVIGKEEKSGFRFFEPDAGYRIRASFTAASETRWVTMETSSGSRKTYRIYGYADFVRNGISCRLTIYQPQSLMKSPEYSDYLFIPFADASNDDSTYEAGRYIDLRMNDVADGAVWIDFNKAYNPYCAYVSGKYNCPIPPRDNHLGVRMDAGEKRFVRN